MVSPFFSYLADCTKYPTICAGALGKGRSHQESLNIMYENLHLRGEAVCRI